MLIWNNSNPLGLLVIQTLRSDDALNEDGIPYFKPALLHVPRSLEPFDTSTTGFSDDEILSPDFYKFERKGYLKYTIDRV